ncbi:hypothetical protein AUT07_00058 [Candidatus Arsenophonus lipoptenae]|uniref:UPF0259 membrane protein AUT07_00058 n=1 Tax=Candidatus Arsenophonus lipoptenae TaxID=634113 RepID=A0A120HPS4_9GAMM|nr:YciC family protein [Candidatus Arsenophonus lipoptenae]AMA64651.1 hypothetical protein AUT07_00058 [Candidatus Arsenophonus lipoptenae]
MSITTISLLRDSFNFFKNQLSDFFILSLISATISLILYYILIPTDTIITIIKLLNNQNYSISLLSWINQLSNEEKKIIIKVSILTLTAIFIRLILLISSVVTYLSEINNGNNISSLQSFILSLRILPNLLILLVICTITIYIGFILFILPGIILTIGLSLSPIILITTKNIMPLLAIRKSWEIAFKYWRLILSMLLFWSILQIILNVLLGQFHFLPGIANNMICFTLNNLLTSFTLIYFFRLNMLTTLIK